MARMISGQPLTDEELIAQTQAYLDQADPMATDSFAMGDTTGTDVTGMTPDPNYQSATPQGVVVPAQTTSQSGGNFGVLDVPFSPPAQDFSYLEDPYSNLSKTQRRMLAFSAIKDAGMALQGKEGNSYATMMADITARADMARKAKAAQQQAERDRLMQMQVMALLGGGTAAASIGQTILPPSGGDLQARIDKLNAAIPSIALQSPEKVEALILQRDQLQAQLDEQEAEAEKAQAAKQGRQSAVRQTQELIDTIEETLRLQVGPDFEAQIDDIADAEETGSRWLAGGKLTGTGLEYAIIVANVNRIKSIMTFENMSKMKQAGITFGSLSNDELKKLESTVGALDAEIDPRLAAKELARIYKDLKEKMTDYELEALMGED